MHKAMNRILPIVIFLVLLCDAGMAQTPPPGGNISDEAPLDGFTGLLLMTGAGYGIRRIRQSRKVGS